MAVIILVDSPLPDGDDWWMETLFLVAVAGSVAVIWIMNPALVFELEARGQQVLSFADNGDEGSLNISSGDAEFMNRVYRERTHEVGYCGLVIGGELLPWIGDTINASKGHVTFRTDTCPFQPDALIHTHPSGSLELSETDKETFHNSSNLEYSCIHGGPISTDPGSSAVNLRCYEKPESGDLEDGFPTVSVKVVQ